MLGPPKLLPPNMLEKGLSEPLPKTCTVWACHYTRFQAYMKDAQRARSCQHLLQTDRNSADGNHLKYKLAQTACISKEPWCDGRKMYLRQGLLTSLSISSILRKLAAPGPGIPPDIPSGPAPIPPFKASSPNWSYIFLFSGSDKTCRIPHYRYGCTAALSEVLRDVLVTDSTWKSSAIINL